jgi:crotonobetainyl-CoA:carnitine CoA-transferase CaiB-like acyl-CoA transferase
MSNRAFQSTDGQPAEDGGTAPAPLHGIRVIELAHWMAGPAAGGVLADWGAEVIKIEPLGGDPMRKLFSTFGLNPDAPNGAFLAANRGKRSIEIEVKTEAGREVLDRLLQRADVLLTNLRPSALERLALTPTAVMARHPRLIYCSVTAYGWGGPDQERAGYDLAAFFGRAGISHQVTTQGMAPAALMQGLGDTFTALAAVSGILAALVERQSTGTGRFVEASLLRTGMWALSGELGVQAMGGHPRPPAPRDMCPTPLFNSYRTGDGRWFFLVGVEASRHLPKVLRAIERPDLLTDERFQGGRQISKNRREFIALLDEAFASKPLAEWIETFNEFDVWWAPVQSPADVVHDPQARASGAWVTVGQGVVGGGAESVDAPIRYDGQSRARVQGAPKIGEQTREVLRELGYSDDTIEEIVASTIAQHGQRSR